MCKNEFKLHKLTRHMCEVHSERAFFEITKYVIGKLKEGFDQITQRFQNAQIPVEFRIDSTLKGRLLSFGMETTPSATSGASNVQKHPEISKIILNVWLKVSTLYRKFAKSGVPNRFMRKIIITASPDGNLELAAELLPLIKVSMQQEKTPHKLDNNDTSPPKPSLDDVSMELCKHCNKDYSFLIRHSVMAHPATAYKMITDEIIAEVEKSLEEDPDDWSLHTKIKGNVIFFIIKH